MGEELPIKWISRRDRVLETFAPVDSGAWRILVTVTLSLGVLYGATAAWSLPYHADPGTNLISGWYLGVEHTVVADRHEAIVVPPGEHGNVAWLVETPAGPVSRYSPGSALTVAPFYAVADTPMRELEIVGTNAPDLSLSIPLPPVWPATLSAVVVTALACGFLALAISNLGSGPRQAMAAGLLFGTATSAWSVASNMSWTHGPGMLAIALACWAASKDRWLLAGLALGSGVLVRPHIAVIAAVLGVSVSLVRRDWRPLVLVGAGSVLGLGALLAYNRAVFGVASVSGGYPGKFSEAVVSDSLLSSLREVALGLVSPTYGLLPWAPFLLLLVPAVVMARRQAPDWTLAMALGGVAYILLQWRANRASGGQGYFAYRYPLEALMAAAPALYVGYAKWLRPHGGLALRLFGYSLILAIVGQAAGAVVT